MKTHKVSSTMDSLAKTLKFSFTIGFSKKIYKYFQIYKNIDEIQPNFEKNVKYSFC